MAIKRTETGWLVDVQPGGRGATRFRKSFKTKAEALAWKAWTTTQHTQNPDWMPARRDTRRLSELIDTWWENHGKGLRSGAGTHRRLLAMCEAMGNPVADHFSADMFSTYRTQRLDSGISLANMNREHAYLRAAFNELIRLKKWNSENPLGEVRAFKVQETELSFLNRDQIIRLLAAMKPSRNPHVELISRICLSTGARWGEAETMRISQVRAGLIQYVKTKSGKSRSVPINEHLEHAIHVHEKEHGQMGRIFGHSISAFREAVERAGIVLPDGQMTHVLRHTFASHFMMNGGNILTLQRILGHANIQMTMRYAHLAPDHLQEVKALNPLTGLTLG